MLDDLGAVTSELSVTRRRKEALRILTDLLEEIQELPDVLDVVIASQPTYCIWRDRNAGPQRAQLAQTTTLVSTIRSGSRCPQTRACEPGAWRGLARSQRRRLAVRPRLAPLTERPANTALLASHNSSPIDECLPSCQKMQITHLLAGRKQRLEAVAQVIRPRVVQRDRHARRAPNARCRDLPQSGLRPRSATWSPRRFRVDILRATDFEA